MAPLSPIKASIFYHYSLDNVLISLHKILISLVGPKGFNIIKVCGSKLLLHQLQNLDFDI